MLKTGKNTKDNPARILSLSLIMQSGRKKKRSVKNTLDKNFKMTRKKENR